MIIRTSKTRNYTVINNTVLRDKRLTWEAKGLAAYLLSQPDDWHVNANHLWQESANGLGTVKRILQELEHNGYLQRTRTRTPEGQFVWEHVLHEAPQPLDGNHTMETVEWKPVDGNHTTETIGWNPSHILSTDNEVLPQSTITKVLPPSKGARDYRNQAHVTANGYTQEAKRLEVEPVDFVAMVNLLLDAAGWTYLVDAGDDRKLDYAKQSVIAMIKMGDDSPDKLQAIIELWKQANDWRNSPPKPDDIAQYASQLRSGVAPAANGKQGKRQPVSKVQMSLDAVQSYFSKLDEVDDGA